MVGASVLDERTIISCASRFRTFGSPLRNGLLTVPHESESITVSSALMRAIELLSVRVAVLFSVARIVSEKPSVEFAQRNVSPGGSMPDALPNTFMDDSLPLSVCFLSFQSERFSAHASSFCISMKSSCVVLPSVCTARMKTFQDDSFASARCGTIKKAPPIESARKAMCRMDAENPVRTVIGSGWSFREDRGKPFRCFEFFGHGSTCFCFVNILVYSPIEDVSNVRMLYG